MTSEFRVLSCSHILIVLVALAGCNPTGRPRLDIDNDLPDMDNALPDQGGQGGREPVGCPQGCRCSADKKVVDCSGLGWTTVPNPTTFPPQMEDVDLSHNQMTQLPVLLFNPWPALRHVKLDSNQINHLKSRNFHAFGALESLSFTNNTIELIQPDAFEGLGNLARLDLSWNSLTFLYEGTLAGLSSLQHIDLAQNPWRCDCDCKWLKNWLDVAECSHTTMHCYLPPEMNGQDWSQLSRDDFCPPETNPHNPQLYDGGPSEEVTTEQIEISTFLIESDEGTTVPCEQGQSVQPDQESMETGQATPDHTQIMEEAVTDTIRLTESEVLETTAVSRRDQDKSVQPEQETINETGQVTTPPPDRTQILEEVVTNILTENEEQVEEEEETTVSHDQGGNSVLEQEKEEQEEEEEQSVETGQTTRAAPPYTQIIEEEVITEMLNAI